MDLFRLRSAGLIGVGLAVALATGCQTYYTPTGQTLPSGYYLTHSPQYNPPTPPFPLAGEQSKLEQAVNQSNNGGAVQQN